ncbi:MAG: hypothetical protein ACR2I5_03270 [Candidatus Limnocylindria bacterium]
MTHGLTQHTRLLSVALASLLLASCGGGESSAQPGTETATTADPQAPVANACPAEGCRITIVNAERDGDEIAVTWETNFVPDISRNHIHIYWDRYTADEVSSDAEARGVSQGEWVPTDVVPTFVTQDVVAVAMRGESTTICVTAGDRDHVVIDATLFDCRDVADLL